VEPSILRAPFAAVVLVVALAGLVALVWAWAAGRTGRRLRAQWERAARGEDEAERLLTSSGWVVLGRQVAVEYAIFVDGERVDIPIRADFIVQRDRRRYVAEVKTGRLAPRIETSATRRQLLEYRVAFGVDGVLLVDAEAPRISLVEFPVASPRPKTHASVAWRLAAVGVAAALVGVVFRLTAEEACRVVGARPPTPESSLHTGTYGALR
jgi:hypothetical protein